MLIRQSWKLTLAIVLAIPATAPTIVQADPPVEPAKSGESAPAVRAIPGVNVTSGLQRGQQGSDKRSTATRRAKPVQAKTVQPKPVQPKPVHPMAGKLQEQIDRSLKQSGRIAEHAERLERAIRRSANARLLADSLGRQLSQNPALGKERKTVLGRALARATEESLPVHERRKNHKEAQRTLLRSAGVGLEIQIPPELVGKFRKHNQRVAMLHRILFIAAQADDYKSVEKAEKLL
ncbi:MAG: hypothetical protein JKY56_01245, partial [Kofleriaceae bacterium]|nr:hypothetical protein [Kofleriaceae bacterium]